MEGSNGFYIGAVGEREAGRGIRKEQNKTTSFLA